MIPIDKCKHGYLYIVACRNAGVGIYDENKRGFRINRFKFDRHYAFVEYHWDIGAPHGTARPLKELFKPAPFDNEAAFLDFMNKYYRENRDEIRNVLKDDEEYGLIFRHEA